MKIHLQTNMKDISPNFKLLFSHPGTYKKLLSDTKGFSIINMLQKKKPLCITIII